MIQPWTQSIVRRGRGTRGLVVAGVLVALGIAMPARAQTRFTSIHDAVPSKFFDAARTSADSSNPNKLIIRFNTGTDLTTFTSAGFVVSSLRRVAMDTISFTVNAPVGFYVSKVTYTQRGTGGTCRTCSSGGAATWVGAGHPANLGVFTNNPTLTGTADLTGMKLATVPVSITDSLFATTGSITISSADVVVQLVPR